MGPLITFHYLMIAGDHIQCVGQWQNERTKNALRNLCDMMLVLIFITLCTTYAFIYIIDGHLSVLSCCLGLRRGFQPV